MNDKRKERLKGKSTKKFMKGVSASVERKDGKALRLMKRAGKLMKKASGDSKDPYSERGRLVVKKREGMAVDGQEYGVDTKTIVRKRGGKTVVKKKGKGTGYANPIKRTKDKTVMKDGVVVKSKKKTTYKKPKKMSKNMAQKNKEMMDRLSKQFSSAPKRGLLRE